MSDLKISQKQKTDKEMIRSRTYILVLALACCGCIGRRTHVHIPRLVGALVPDATYWAGQWMRPASQRYTQIKFTGLNGKANYTFWISRARTLTNNHSAYYPITSPDSMAIFRNLELSLYDKKGRELKYNGDYTSRHSDGTDTLALIRLRTLYFNPYKTVILRVTSLGRPLKSPPPPFEIHLMEKYVSNAPANTVNRQGQNNAASNAPPVAEKLASNPIKFRYGSIFNDTVTADTAENGDIPHAQYEDGYGLAWRNEQPFRAGDTWNARDPRCFHNYVAYWMVPTAGAQYQFSLTDIAGDSLELALFEDSGLTITDEMDSTEQFAAVAHRMMSICDDEAVGVKMIASGSRLQVRSDSGFTESIVIGECANARQGIVFDPQKTYYLFVLAPMGKLFQCQLSVTNCNGSSVALPHASSYFSIPIAEMRYLGDSPNGVHGPLTSDGDSRLPLIQDEWSDHAWFSIVPPPPAFKGYEIAITAAPSIQGAAQVYSFGDPSDLETYTPRGELGIFEHHSQTIKLMVDEIPMHKELRLLIAVRPGMPASVSIQITPLPIAP